MWICQRNLSIKVFGKPDISFIYYITLYHVKTFHVFCSTCAAFISAAVRLLFYCTMYEGLV